MTVIDPWPKARLLLGLGYPVLLAGLSFSTIVLFLHAVPAAWVALAILCAFSFTFRTGMLVRNQPPTPAVGRSLPMALIFGFFTSMLVSLIISYLTDDVLLGTIGGVLVGGGVAILRRAWEVQSHR